MIILNMDKIYKEYLKGGKAWATLSEGIAPAFKQFLSQSNFKTKHVLDIGCGTGKYLKFLKASGFKTDGIDSSETAVKMTKKSLGDDSKIVFVNMFDFRIPKNKYDIIISVATIHHGTKRQVRNLVNRIHSALINRGKIFITLPNYENRIRWDTFKKQKEIAPGTYAPLLGPEKGLPHSFYTKVEVKKLFSKYKNLKLKLIDHGRWVIQASK
jgi:cyclopropane fatty-acyl-phospholipid synthase-like methyltransferase